MTHDWLKAYRERLDETIMSNLGATTVTKKSRQQSTAFTMERLQDAMNLVKDMPPPPFFASSLMFPADQALRFTFDRIEHVGAHPDFWEKVLKECDFREAPNAGLYDIPLIDLDLSCNIFRRDLFMDRMLKVAAT